MTDNATLQRLGRLEGYLQQDPDNLNLLADAFDAAMEAGAFERAEPHLRHAQSLAPATVAWRMREAHWLMAQRRWEEADSALSALQANANLSSDGRAALLHDLAQMALQRGETAVGLDRLRPLVTPIAPQQPLDEDLQLLWLRLLHRSGQLPEALAWAEARWQATQLASGAAGAASLVALDANDGARSLAWADFALKREPQQLEALVARATLALAQTDAVLARQLLGQALQGNPTDGRSLSVLGFADLLERKLEAACNSFEAAVQHMPQHIGTWHGLGWARLLRGDLPAAQRAFETALELDRTFGESHGGLAVLQAMRGERDAAEASIERALRLDRNAASAQFARAVLSGDANDPAAIQRLATRILRQRPGGAIVSASAPPETQGH